MYVQYDCNRPSTFRDLFRKRSVRQNVQIGYSSEPKVGQSSYTQKGTTTPLEVLCVKFEDNRTSTFRDMLWRRNVHGRPNSPTAHRRNIIILFSAIFRIEFRFKIF